MNLFPLAATGDPGPAEYYQYFIITAAVLVAFKHALDLWKAHLRPPEPMPPLHKEYASRENLASLDARLDALAADLETRSGENLRASSASREKIYESIRSLERGVASMQKETELLTQRLHHLDAKLDRLIERMTFQSED
jgi:hypothetical protein